MTSEYPKHQGVGGAGQVTQSGTGGHALGSDNTFPVGFAGAVGTPRFFVDQLVQLKDSPAVNNSTAFQSLTALSFKMEPGTAADFEIFLLYTCSATSDFIWKLTADVGAGLDEAFYAMVSDPTTGLGFITYASSTAITPVSNGGGADPQGTWARGVLRNKGTFLITVTPQFSQNIAEVSDTKVLAGSFLRYGFLGTLE